MERLLVFILLIVITTSNVAFVPSPSRRSFYSRYSTKTFASLELWLDATSVCPASPERVKEADAVLVVDDVPLPFEYQNEDIPTFTKRGDKLIKDDGVAGAIVDIGDAAGQDKALAAVGSVEYVLASCHGDAWMMIPAENLIAAGNSAGTKIAMVVERVEDIVGLSRALELGVDILCVAADAPDNLWTAVVEERTERNSQQKTNDVRSDNIATFKPQIVKGSCCRMNTKSVLADRVCVDLVRTLSQHEGCFVGSSVKIMALVLSEAATSSFVPSRPFRINAGPVHSYILLGDGVTTKYLCELQAGEDEVFVYDALTGKSRSVAVGRLKTEIRPCLAVSLNYNSLQSFNKETSKDFMSGQVFLQQAETVRLSKEGQDFVRVTDLEVNNTEDIIIRTTTSGTHVGRAYTGKVVEQ